MGCPAMYGRHGGSMMGGGMHSGMDMQVPMIPAPMMLVAFLFGLMLGKMMARKRMMGMYGGMGMGMGGYGKMGMGRSMMMHHHHHGAGQACCCGKTESGEEMPRGGDRTD